MRNAFRNGFVFFLFLLSASGAGATCGTNAEVMKQLIDLHVPLSNCTTELKHKNGQIAYSPVDQDWFYSNGQKAFSRKTGDWFYSNGDKLYTLSNSEWFHPNGKKAYSNTFYGSWFHANGEKAFAKNYREWFYDNGKKVYSPSTGEMFYADGQLAAKSIGITPIEMVEFMQQESCFTKFTVFCAIARLMP